MKKHIITLAALFFSVMLNAETVENFPWGHFDKWTVRYIAESGLLGGETRAIYCPGPVDTIRKNEPFVFGKQGCPWATSNVYASPGGIDKASCTVVPDKRGNGYCAKMMSILEKVKAMGFINKTVQASGSVFTGKMIEPVKDTKEPNSKMDIGVPFTKRPDYLQLDYKCIISAENTYTYASSSGDPTTKNGHDEAQAYLYLQSRWEDADGNVYAKRVGTASYRFTKTQSQWVNDFRIPVRYGDITKQPDYKSYEGLQTTLYVKNSKGKMVPLKEVGYDADAKPTHIIIFMSVGSLPAYNGHVGNALWVDNIKLVYN